MPWPLQTAIEFALTVLNWMQNLPREDVPPEHLWTDQQGLADWWKQVEYRREAAQSGGGEPQEMVENELVRELKRG